ncbi:MAG: hypothetical protein ABIG61_11260 [Planctomycetota bacterium]
MKINLKLMLASIITTMLICPAVFAAKIFEEKLLGFDYYKVSPDEPFPRLHGTLDANWVRIPTGWGNYPGPWRDNGTFNFHNGGWGEMSALAQDLVLTAGYTVDIDARTELLLGTSRRCSILFGSQNTTSYMPKGYLLYLYGSPDRTGIPPNYGPYAHSLYFFKVLGNSYADGNNVLLGRLLDANSLADDKWHTWTINVQRDGNDNQITVSVDGNAIVWDGNEGQTVGSSLVVDAGGYSGGTVGMWMPHERRVLFDNIIVYDANGIEVYKKGDINKDGQVDGKDLKQLTEDWLAGVMTQTVFEEHVTVLPDGNSVFDNNWIRLPSDGNASPEPYLGQIWYSNGGSGEQAAYAADLTLPSSYTYEYKLETHELFGWAHRLAAQFASQQTDYHIADGYMLQVYGGDYTSSDPEYGHILYLIRYDFRGDVPNFVLGTLSDATALVSGPHTWKIDVTKVNGTDYITCYVDGQAITWDSGIFAGYSTARDPLSWPTGGTAGHWNAHEREFVVDDIIIEEKLDTYFDSGYKDSDINRDWRVDFKDFALFSEDW